jgi:hypothetical protein
MGLGGGEKGSAEQRSNLTIDELGPLSGKAEELSLLFNFTLYPFCEQAT